MPRSPRLVSARSCLLLFSGGALLAACSTPAADDAGFDATIRYGGDGAALDSPRDSPDTGPLSDGEIVGVLHTIHQGDLLVAQFMAANTVREDVRVWALDLAAQHTTADASLLSAASAAGVVAADTSISQRQASLRMQELDAVTAESCATRDERYLGFQSLVSGEALAIIDDNLLPAVMDAGLRMQIETTRAIVNAQYQGLPVADGGYPEAAMPNWEAGPSFDSGCPSTAFDAFFDVGPDS